VLDDALAASASSSTARAESCSADSALLFALMSAPAVE
jgi:hypothetical protein